MKKNLPDLLYSKITSLCKQGDELVKGENFKEAKSRYIEALKLLPDSPNDWEAATWIYVAIGDIYFRISNFEKCFMCFYNAVQCPTGLGNPYIHLRLGQMYFEQENYDKSADELTRAYMGPGMDIFIDDDPKYFNFLETKIEI